MVTTTTFTGMGLGSANETVEETIRQKEARRTRVWGVITCDSTPENEGNRIGQNENHRRLVVRSGGSAAMRVYWRVERLKIVFVCILASVLYGIVHDQFTARICIEYFTVFHPPVFATQSPTLLGIGWGIIATWWAGAIIGVLLSTAARSGPINKLTARQMIPFVARLMILMALCAFFFGIIGYFWGSLPADFADVLPRQIERRFLADWWAHNASYASGFVGGFCLCVIVWVKRRRTSLIEPLADRSVALGEK